MSEFLSHDVLIWLDYMEDQGEDVTALRIWVAEGCWVNATSIAPRTEGYGYGLDFAYGSGCGYAHMGSGNGYGYGCDFSTGYGPSYGLNRAYGDGVGYPN